MSTSKRQKKKFDPKEIAERAISSDYDRGEFGKFEDTHIKRPKNFYEFCVGEEFLHTTIFQRQVQMGLQFFGEYCPRCSTPGYIDDLFDQSFTDIERNVCMLEHGVCPRCSVTQTELFSKKELGEYNELDVCCGRRAGKTIFASMIAAYQLCRFLLIKDISTYYPGVIKGQKFFMLFVAINKGVAEDTVWAAFNGRIQESPWFKTYHEWLKTYAKEFGLEPQVEIKDTFILYKHKRIECQVTTPNIKSARGRTCLMTSVDESSWIDVGSSGDGILVNAEETHNALSQSNTTIRAGAITLRSKGNNNVPTAIDMNISSPSSANDFTMRAVRKSLEVPSICGFHYATWKVNPNVTEAHLEDEKKKGLKIFLRDYAAEPSLGDEHAFMDDEVAVKTAFVKGKINNVAYAYKSQINHDGSKSLWVSALPRVRDSVPRIMALDPGESDNSFAVVVASLTQEGVSLDAVLECEPQKLPDGSVAKVNFPKMFEECIKPLLGPLNVKMLVSDRWQSSYLLDSLRNARFRAQSKTLKHSDFSEIRTAWYSGRIKAPDVETPIDDFRRSKMQLEAFTEHKPVTKLAIQACSVREIGLKVVKPVGGTDDIFRAACLAINSLLDKENSKIFMYSEGGTMKNTVNNRGFAIRPAVVRSGTMPRSNVGARVSRSDPTGGVVSLKRGF